MGIPCTKQAYEEHFYQETGQGDIKVFHSWYSQNS